MTFTPVGQSALRCRAERYALGLLFGVFCLGLLPGAVRAHEISDKKFAAPLPLPLLLAGAGITVAMTAALLALSDSKPVPRAAERPLLTVPAHRWSELRDFSAVLFAGIVMSIMAVGIVGRQVPNENIATVFTWGVWIHGLALVAIVVGNPWPVLSPWRLVYRGLTALEDRDIALVGGSRAPTIAWPALGGFLVLVGVIENLTVIPRSPRLTAAIVAGYGFVIVGGAMLFGTRWFDVADPLEVLYDLLGRVSPVAVLPDEVEVSLSVRLPWQATTKPIPDTSIIAFVVAMVYTVSFDGFIETRTYQSTLFAMRDYLGTGEWTSLLLYLAGFCGFVTLFVVACWGCERLGAEGGGWWSAAGSFAPSVIPIAAAYEVAHNYPFVLRSAGRGVALAVWPLVPGVEAFDPLWWVTLPQFWASQVLLIVVGHVIAVVAAHYIAVDLYESRSTLGHLPMVMVMVGYTVLSLWIISQPLVTTS